MNNDVWVVGRWSDERWELQGVYTTRDLALAASWSASPADSRSPSPGWVLGPVPLNQPLSEESEEWPGMEVLDERADNQEVSNAN